MLESFICCFVYCISRTAYCFLSFFITDGTFFWLHSVSTSACVPACPEHQITFGVVITRFLVSACFGYSLDVENIKWNQKGIQKNNYGYVGHWNNETLSLQSKIEYVFNPNLWSRENEILDLPLLNLGSTTEYFKKWQRMALRFWLTNKYW